MKSQYGYIDLTGVFLTIAVVCVVIGIALAQGLPWLWNIVKPWLHALTA